MYPLFIDEVDAIFRKRTGEEKPWTVAMLTEFMQSMDGLTSKLDNKGVVVIGATNRPYDLDDAILRRLPCRMLIDLPGELQRQNILHTFLKDETLSDDIDIKEFAQLTVNYSGSDLKNACVSAALAFVKAALGVSGDKSLDQFQKAKELNDAEKVEYPEHCITKQNLLDGIAQVRPSFSIAASVQLYTWYAKFSSNVSRTS